MVREIVQTPNTKMTIKIAKTGLTSNPPFVYTPMTLNMLHDMIDKDWKSEYNRNICSNELQKICEARGSIGHWVDELFEFYFFYEKSPPSNAPSDLKPGRFSHFNPYGTMKSLLNKYFQSYENLIMSYDPNDDDLVEWLEKVKDSMSQTIDKIIEENTWSEEEYKAWCKEMDAREKWEKEQKLQDLLDDLSINDEDDFDDEESFDEDSCSDEDDWNYHNTKFFVYK